MIGHPSRFRNIWAPEPEHMILSEEYLKEQNVEVRVRQGVSAHVLEQRPQSRRAKVRFALESLQSSGKKDFGNQTVYDARFEFNGNIAHLIGSHLANLGFAKKELNIGPGDCMIVLEKNASEMAHRFFEFVGYETTESNVRIQGHLLEVEVDRLENYLLAPYVRYLEPPQVKPGGVERLFLSRLSSRKIENEEEIWNHLKPLGFERYYFEEQPLERQWSLIRDAKEIVAIHGAALGYLATKGVGTSNSDYNMLEVFSPGLVADIFRKTTAVIGGRWSCCRGRVDSAFVKGVEESDDVKSMDGANFYLDPQTFERALNLSGIGKAA